MRILNCKFLVDSIYVDPLRVIRFTKVLLPTLPILLFHYFVAFLFCFLILIFTYCFSRKFFMFGPFIVKVSVRESRRRTRSLNSIFLFGGFRKFYKFHEIQQQGDSSEIRKFRISLVDSRFLLQVNVINRTRNCLLVMKICMQQMVSNV